MYYGSGTVAHVTNDVTRTHAVGLTSHQTSRRQRRSRGCFSATADLHVVGPSIGLRLICPAVLPSLTIGQLYTFSILIMHTFLLFYCMGMHFNLKTDTRKDRGKVTAYRKSSRFFERFHPRPPTSFSSWRLCFETATQNSNQSLLGLPRVWVKVRTSNFVRCHGIDRNKSPLKMSGKLVVRVAMQGLPKMFRAPIWAIGRIARSSLR